MIVGLKHRLALIYGTTIFAVVVFISSLIITVFNYHFTSLNLLTNEIMERFRATYIGIGLIFIPVSAFFSYLVGWIISEQLHNSRYEITPRMAQTPPLPTARLEEEFQIKMSSIRSSVEKMREAYEQIQHFSVNASHELRTPLTIMRGEIELALRSQKRPEQYQDTLASLLEEILRLSRIIDDLLLVAKTQLNQAPMERHIVDLREMLEEMCDEVELFASQGGITFERGPMADATIVCDPLRIRRVILNLVDNAVKYNNAGGSVTLSLSTSDGYAFVSIKDTGIGIPAHELPRIFDRFYRVDPEHTKGRSGTGLGLFIVQWIVATHGGEILVDSTAGAGSEFIIKLPLGDTTS
ncbi:MAG: hypothetical protein HY962_04975 [Ignavibacteriae bacterium]|nr:hypothetical protein [Ignavibacteriota bacterium]